MLNLDYNFQISKNRKAVLRYNENGKMVDHYIQQQFFEAWKCVIWYDFFFLIKQLLFNEKEKKKSFEKQRKYKNEKDLFVSERICQQNDDFAFQR